MLWNSAGSFANMVCAWLITVLVLRLSTGYDAAGVYSYIMSVYAIFSSVVDYRIYVYQISDLHGENTLGEYFTLRCITGTLGLALVMVYSVLTGPFELLPTIFFYSLYKIASVLLDAFHASEQIYRRMDYIGMSYALQGVVSFAVFGVVFGVTQDLTLTMAVLFLATVAIGFFYDFPRIHFFSEFHFGISRQKTWRLLKTCAPAVIAFVAISGSTSVPRQYLMKVMGESALGAYGTMAAPIAIVQTGASYIYNPLLTYFNEAYDQRNGARFLKMMMMTAFAIATLGIVCIIGVKLLGGPVYSLIYGQRVLEYLYLLPPLVVSALCIAFMGFVNNLVTVLHNFKATFTGGLTALSISLIIMIPMINHFELNGVTYTTLISALGASLVMFLLVKKQLDSQFAASE